IPLMLLLQSAICFLIGQLWKAVSSQSGLHLINIIDAAQAVQNALYPERREKTLKYISRHITRFLTYQTSYRGGWCRGLKAFLAVRLHLKFGQRFGNYLSVFYIFLKIMNIANVFLQFFLIGKYLGGAYHYLGFFTIPKFIHLTNRLFPKVTFCDFRIRRITSSHLHTVQCVLSANFINEKVFIILWFWLVLLQSLNVYSFVVWFSRLCVKKFRRDYVIRQMLMIRNRGFGVGLGFQEDYEQLLQSFADNFLRQDGIFVLKMLAKNSTRLVESDIIALLWE
ncbi:hypothetical protein HELRODRAFT_122048, partial [Helobdella robusta]|uniref:Innexin n=1 Tax=Helobdella robusta TaxID=6412 RepID=T1EGT7_HELRO